jgi:hypothetical protein
MCSRKRIFYVVDRVVENTRILSRNIACLHIEISLVVVPLTIYIFIYRISGAGRMNMVEETNLKDSFES